MCGDHVCQLESLLNAYFLTGWESCGWADSRRHSEPTQSTCSAVLEHVRVFMSIMYHVLLPLFHFQYSWSSVFHCNHGNRKWQMAELWKRSGYVLGWMEEQASLIENQITMWVNTLAGLHLCRMPLLKTLNMQGDWMNCCYPNIIFILLGFFAHIWQLTITIMKWNIPLLSSYAILWLWIGIYNRLLH